MMALILKEEDNYASVGDVFSQFLKELGISEFPRGLHGKWRNNLKWESDLLELQDELCADLFTIEKLLELSSQKPFSKEIKWSSDAASLQTEAIEFPDMINLDNIHQKFKSLKLIDKNIKDVDEYITKFTSLQELTLSANRIKYVKAKILPRQLRVLELCGNQLNENIGCLCNSPPPLLQHIGLSHNAISSFSSFIRPQPNCWSSLLSLDLSDNNLIHIIETVNILKRLPQLQNLHLIGNPLYLFVGYRGFIVDSLKKLTFLDEINISANERHLFKGMSRMNTLPTCDFSVVDLKLDDFKGKIKNTQTECEDVIRTFVKYHIEFTFMKDCTVLDVGDLLADSIEGDTIQIIPECCDSNDVDDLNQVIKSNEFNFTDEGFQFNLNKYIICKNLKHFAAMLRSKIEIRLIRTNITMSTEPIDNELMLIPNIKDSSVAEKGGKTSSVSKDANKRTGSAKSIMSNSKRTATKLAKPKKAKVNIDEFYELTRTSEIYASVTIDCSSILDGYFLVEQNCSLVSIVSESETEPEIENITLPVEKTKKKLGKSPLKHSDNTSRVSHAKKADAIIEEVESDHDISQENTEPPSLQFSLKVIQWKNAKEAFDWMEKFGSKTILKS